MSEKLTLPKAVIFDWDNTLVDSWPAIAEAINLTREKFGLAVWSMDDIKLNCTRAARDSFPEWFGDKWKDAYEVYYKGFDEVRRRRDIGLLPGSLEVLTWLQQNKIPAFVVSNKRGDYLRIEVEKVKWRGFFAAIVGAQNSPRDKPAREHVDFALKDSGIKAGTDVWFVGDSETDMLCAYNSGCTPVLIGNADLAHQMNVELVFSDCRGVQELLSRIRSAA